MMAGLMLVFALVMFFTIFQFVELQETRTAELSEKENQVLAQQGLLATQQERLDDQESRLVSSQALLDTQQQTLSAQRIELDTASKQLADKQAQLDGQNAQLAQAQILLEQTQAGMQVQQRLLDEQATRLTSQQGYMDQQQQRIDALIGVRTRIIESLRDELAKARLDVAVDQQTGAIALKGAVLFDVGKSDLKDSGKQLLNTFIPVYVRTLLASGNSEYVGEIIIEGHADTDGDYLVNLDLSQKRALAVAQYCLQDGFGGLNATERRLLRTIMTANGRSWSNPVYAANGTVNKEASRRVEFKFRLKDAEMINEMSAIMENRQEIAD
jgi:chemotaxis protein MotB